MVFLFHSAMHLGCDYGVFQEFVQMGAIFMTGFFGNAILSVLIVFLGTKLGLDLYIAVGVVFAIRIFQNFAIIRRFLLNKWPKGDKIEKNAEKKA